MLGAALSIGNELSASLGAFSLSAVGAKLGDEPEELLGDPPSVDDRAELSDPISLGLNPAVGYSSGQHWEKCTAQHYHSVSS